MFLRSAMKTIRYWRRLVPSPAKSNDSVMLELPRAWEPADRRLAYRIGASTSSFYRVFSQNMDKQSKARISSKAYRF